jgi:hypothetical protein
MAQQAVARGHHPAGQRLMGIQLLHMPARYVHVMLLIPSTPMSHSLEQHQPGARVNGLLGSTALIG